MRQNRNQSTGQKAKPGPKTERLKITGNWQAAMKQAFVKKKPAQGWPK
jgi:hypothetical protein